MPRKKSVRDAKFEPGARALVRVDYNVPFAPGEPKRVSDDTRIAESLDTIEHLISRGCRVILCSHLGRPKGKRREGLSLSPVAERLRAMASFDVAFAADCVGNAAERAVSDMRDGGVLLLENLRFHAGEEANDARFARRLASLADFYVNDGFGAAHRRHASTVGVADYLPACAGLLMEREIEALRAVTERPRKPYALVVGGAKVADKLPVMENLARVADVFLIGGGMAAAFLAASGALPARSDAEDAALAARILERARREGCEVVLPTDVVVAERFAKDAARRACAPADAPDGWRILDIGAQTAARYAERLSEARTVVWNGPMGVFEWSPFAHGTRAVGEAIAALDCAYTVTGGGSTADAVRSLGIRERFSHVSTGGGATLECLEGRELPGIAALGDASDGAALVSRCGRALE